MFKSIKDSGDQVSSVLEAFYNAGTASDVFSTVVSAYSGYLSDMFWGEILEAIDWESITTVITDVLGPIFEGFGTVIGGMIEDAPIGTTLGGAIGGLIGSFFGHPLIGAAIGGGLGYIIESVARNIQAGPTTVVDVFSDVLDLFYDILGVESPSGTPSGEFTVPVVGGHYAPELQYGGIPSRRMEAIVEPHEAIIPLEELYRKFDEFIDVLTSINTYQEKMWRDKEYRHR